MKANRIIRLLVAASALTISASGSGLTQYKPIPNYTGIGAGAQFRGDINNHLSGAAAIAPRLVSLTLSQLPAEQDGQLYWCLDCQQVTPCAGGGTGAMALGAHGQWACAAGSASGSPVGPAGNDLTGSYPNPIVSTVLNGKTPVTTQNAINTLSPASGNYSMGGNRLQNLGADASTGDALGRGISTLNSLGLPAANYNMNSQTLTGLAAASANGQPLAYGQTGAQLNGLNLNNNQISNLLAASTSGQALTFGQGGGQLAAAQTPFVAASATAQHSGTSLAIPAPSGLSPGTDVEFAVVSYQGAGTISAPTGWTNVRVDCAGGNCQRIDYHVVGASEPVQYTWSCSSGPNQFNGGIADVRNVNTTTPVDVHLGTNTSAATVTLTALAPTATGELAMVAISGGAPVYISSTPPNGTRAQWFLDQAGAWGALVETFPVFTTAGIAISAQYAAAQNSTFAMSEVIIKGVAGTSNPVVTHSGNASHRSLRGGAADGSNTIDGFNLNGVFNVVAFGATPDASSDSSGAVQAAVNAACVAAANLGGGVPQVPSVYIPAGEYLFLKPVVIACGTSIRVYGDGPWATQIVQKVSNLTNSFGPIFIAPASNAISSMNSGVVTAASLETGAGRSFFWANSTVGIIFDLSDVMRAISVAPFNGLSALDIRAFWKIGATPGGSGVYLFSSDGKADGQGCGPIAPGGVWTCNGASKVYVDSNLALRAIFNVGGTLQEVHSANSAFTLNSTHEVEAVFDGSNVCLFLDGARVGTAAIAGTITQRADEDVILGGDAQVFPMSSFVGTMQGAAPAYVDSFEIRKTIPSGRTCANSSYTADTSKFGGDNNSLLLLNFDNLLSITGGATSNGPFLIGADRFNGIDMTPGDGPAGQGAWLAARNIGLTLGNGQEFDDFGATGTVGVLGITNTNGRYRRLNLTGAYAGFAEFSSSFNNEEDSLVLSSSTLAPYIDSNGSGVTKATNLQMNACGWACMLINNSGGTWSKTYMAPQTNTVWGIVDNQFLAGFNEVNFIDPAQDVENCGTTIGVLMAGQSSLNVFGGGLTSCTNQPVLVISPNSVMNVSMHGTALGISGTPSQIINVESPSNGFGGQAYTGHVLADNVAFSVGSTLFEGPPFNIPWSNLANIVSVLGPNFQLAGVPTFNQGLQHLSVPGVTTPAAPTISVVGGAGSTAYGPYYVVCHDFNGGSTFVSNASNTVANGPAALNGSNYIQINWTGNANCSSWDVLKGTASTALATGLSGKSASYNDQGQSTSAYTPPLRNTTGDVTAGTMFISSGTTFASMPGAVVNGGHFYCSDCDPPANPPTACTSSGAKTGSMVYGVHNQWICAY